MKSALLLGVLIAAGCSCVGQSQWEHKRDSLSRLLLSAAEDSNKAVMLLDIGWTFMNSNTDSAVVYFKACNELSKKLNFIVGQLRYRFCYSQVLYMRGLYDEELAIDLETIDLAKRSWSANGYLLSAYSNIASDYINVNRGDKAMEFYQKTIALSEQTGKKKILARTFSNMVGYYKFLGMQPETAYHYGLEAIALSRTPGQEEVLDEALSHTGHVLIDMKRYDSALLLQQQAQVLAIQNDDKVFEAEILLHINEMLIIKGQYKSIKANASKIEELSVATNNQEGIADAKYYDALYYFYNKDYREAALYADTAIIICKAHRIDHLAQNVYLLRSDIALASGDIAGYNRNRLLSDSLNEVVQSAQLTKNAQEIEGKFSLDKKQSEINNLNKEKEIHQLLLQQNRRAITTLFITLAALALIAFSLLRNSRQKKKLLLANDSLQRQRIAELEKEKQLLAANAILQGHEEERTRLAKDLHDGLGGILSSAKYSFNNMKNNFIITPESAEAFDRSMAMLDKSISELRAVSHNMMPEALVQFGLNTALKDYCNSINSSGSVIVSYQSFDVDDNAVPKVTASVVYRIIQELLNNIVKHSEAKTALVQLVGRNSSLSIAVEDDGKGYDTAAASASGGIGLKNLENRVAYLKGTIDVATSSGKGTSVNIEIPNIN